MTPREEVKAAYQKVEDARQSFFTLCEKFGSADLGVYRELAEMQETRAAYPLEVTGIRAQGFLEPNPLSLNHQKPGDFVSIRPVAEEHEGKTFFGIYMGDLPIGVNTRADPESGVLTIWPHHNPAIWVPALGRIVYGCQSWWGPIKDPKAVRQITDDDIQNVWYVKALKSACAEGSQDTESPAG